MQNSMEFQIPVAKGSFIEVEELKGEECQGQEKGIMQWPSIHAVMINGISYV